MKVLYDREADALYLPIQPRETAVDKSVFVDELRTVDLDSRGEVVGIEILSASLGIRLLDLVDRFDLRGYEDVFSNIEAHKFDAVEFA